MKEVFKVIPSIPNGVYALDVKLNDTALISLSARDLYNAFFKIKRFQNKPIHINLTIDNEYSSIEYNSLFSKLKEATEGNVKIDIYTSGRNFDQIMSYIGTDGSDIDYVVYIDDHNIREILDSGCFNFSNAACPCYLSRRYIRNLDDIDFNSIYESNLFIFDRDEALLERKIIYDVWQEIIPSEGMINKLTQESKMILIADYINENIRYANDGYRLTGQFQGRNLYYVEKWAKYGIGTYQYKRGVCSGQSDLACILLDNYYAKTNCRCVDGLHIPTRDPHAWIILCAENGNYGICLTMPKRFVDLIEYGYADGKISLEFVFTDREDYEINVDSYVDIPRQNYDHFKANVYKFLKEYENKEKSVPPLPTRKVISPPPLPKKRKVLPPPLPSKQ